MLNRLRWQFSLIYLLAAIALMALIGGGAYRLLDYYFQSSTDLALRYRVALEFEKLGVTLPAELQAASLEWQTSRNQIAPTPIPTTVAHEEEEEEEENEKQADGSSESGESTEPYDSELSSIFVLPIDAQGGLVFNPNTYTPPLDPNRQAVNSALKNGSDLRTVRLANGTRARLLTYRLPGASNPALIQVGRSLADQDRILNQLLVSLVTLGGLSALLVGAGSWWLAGRSLRPAQEAWNRQQAFVANASHELRAPLTLMRASAEVAQRGLAQEDTRSELLKDILSESDHMSRLVDDLLLLSRLDSGRLALERVEIPLDSFLEDLGRQTGHLAEKQGIRLEISAPKLRAVGDPARLRQVLIILLDNALRHTPAGGAIRLEARQAGAWAQITVSDTGGGIAAEHLPHIFERFYRGTSQPGQSGGSGLGLSIARALVDAQHGQISVASQPGKGTQASVRLPSSVKSG